MILSTRTAIYCVNSKVKKRSSEIKVLKDSAASSILKPSKMSPEKCGNFEESIPVIDLAPFFEEKIDEDAKAKVLQQVSKALEEWGFFQVINHGLDDSDLLESTLQNCKEFFSLPLEAKLKVKTEYPPVGFVHQSGVGGKIDRKEHLFFHAMHNPASKMNVWPESPPTFGKLAQELIAKANKTGRFLVSIVSESLNLPKDYLSSLYSEVGDALILLKYPPTPADHLDPVLAQHRDADILTVVAQLNQADGLEVLKDDKWVRVKPVKNALVINAGDVLQVWSNGRYKSVLHRVTANQTGRYSFAYFHMPGGGTQIAPLAQFTTEANEAPLYRPFLQGEYLQLRFENKKLDSKNAKEITVEHFAI